MHQGARPIPQRNASLGRIPLTIWGEPSTSVVVAVHGYFSSRYDPVIEVLSQTVSCQVVSFDLPGHGSRTHDPVTDVWPAEALRDVNEVFTWAFQNWSEVSLFSVSMGAYLSLLACSDRPLHNAWLLSPVTDLLAMIKGSMEAASVSEEQLEAARTIAVPDGEQLSWPYFSFASKHVPSRWEHPTEILHVATDMTVPVEHSVAFAERSGSHLTVLSEGEHWFHTPDQLRQLSDWLRRRGAVRAHFRL